MDITDLCFTTFSFGHLHVHQQNQMRESILRVYPDANMMFWATEDPSSTHPPDTVPPGYTSFHESTYGFKVHCIRNCIDAGYKKVIFLDAAMQLHSPIDEILELAHKHGVLATIGGATLENVTSDKCLNYIGKPREEITGWKMVGGSIYVFDFTNPVAMKVFEYWEDLENKGYFGSEEEHCRGKLQGHRQDETCMSLALYEYGVPIVGYDEIGYHNLGLGGNSDVPFVFYKLHHRDIGRVQDHSFIQHLVPMYGNVLILGCRDFVTTDWFENNEYRVYPVDIGDLNTDRWYYRMAITDKKGMVGVSKEPEGRLDATHVIPGDEIESTTIEEFTDRVGVGDWHLMIMDIEDSEYEVLKQAVHPIADQISIEFHHHLGRSKEDLDELLDMLSEYYIIHNRIWEEGQGSGFNYWDVLLVNKRIL